jgi:hypothetical protein
MENVDFHWVFPNDWGPGLILFDKGNEKAPRFSTWAAHVGPTIQRYDKWPIRLHSLQVELFTAADARRVGVYLELVMMTSPQRYLILDQAEQTADRTLSWRGDQPVDFGFGLKCGGTIIATDWLVLNGQYERRLV